MAPTLPSGRVGKIVVRVSRTPPGPRMARFPKPLIPLFLVVLAAATGAVLGAAQSAQARTMTTCSRALIHDWYVDGRVDKTYPIHCYREALTQIPEDQAIYGTLRQDLTRALQSAIRQHGGHVTGDTLVAPLGGSGNGGGGPNGSAGTGATAGKGGIFHWVARKLGPSTADSIPVPLLVLGGLALALIAAAGVSFFARRMQARRAADPPPTAL